MSVRSRRGRLGFVTAAFLGLVALPLEFAVAEAPPAGAVWSEAYFSSQDGTRLHADVFRPLDATPGQRLPVALVVTPYLGTPTPTEPTGPKVLRWYRGLYERAIGRGYAVVQVSLRGSGASAGCSDFGGTGEQQDVAAALAWAATQEWSTGAIGMIGHSYDGFTALVGVAQPTPALKAAVVIAPAVSLYRGVFMNGVEYLQSPGIAAYYQGLSLIPPLDPFAAGTVTTRDPACAAGVVEQSRNPDHQSAFWRTRDLTQRLAGSSTPMLWAHGFLDGRDDFSAVRPDNFLDVWKRLTGPRRAWFGQFPHVVPGERNTWNEPEPTGRDGFVNEAIGWLDAYVRNDAAARAAVTTAPPVTVQEGAEGRWRSEQEWPPPSTGAAVLPLRPGDYTDAAGNKAEQGDDPGGGCADGIRARCNPASTTGRGSWTFSPAMPHAMHLAGTMRLEATLRPAAEHTRVIAVVYDLGPDHRATLLTRGASLVPEAGQVSFDLYPQDWHLKAGHRLGVLLSGSDDFYFAPGTTGARVNVVEGRLRVAPVCAEGTALAGEPSRAVRERTSFPVEPGIVTGRSSTLVVPSQARCSPRPDVVRARLVRRCTRRGRLHVALRHAGPAVRRVDFRLGRRLVARDRTRPFRTTLARRTLQNTRGRHVRAVIFASGGGPASMLRRTRPSCRRDGTRDSAPRRRPKYAG